eukprot:1195022-Prorocentrum_minimum.AAC.6
MFAKWSPYEHLPLDPLWTPSRPLLDPHHTPAMYAGGARISTSLWTPSRPNIDPHTTPSRPPLDPPHTPAMYPGGARISTSVIKMKRLRSQALLSLKGEFVEGGVVRTHQDVCQLVKQSTENLQWYDACPQLSVDNIESPGLTKALFQENKTEGVSIAN